GPARPGAFAAVGGLHQGDEIRNVGGGGRLRVKHQRMGFSSAALAAAPCWPRASSQLPSIWYPPSVSTDSGWYWRPHRGAVLWASPIIPPSAVVAVTSRTSGTV